MKRILILAAFLALALPASAPAQPIDATTPVTVVVQPGNCVGFDLAAASTGNMAGLSAGVTYRIIAMKPLWLRYDGQNATVDAPSEFFDQGQSRLYRWRAAPTVRGILATGAAELATKEVLFCPQSRTF
jgi:hypothetical protein